MTCASGWRAPDLQPNRHDFWHERGRGAVDAEKRAQGSGRAALSRSVPRAMVEGKTSGGEFRIAMSGERGYSRGRPGWLKMSLLPWRRKFASARRRLLRSLRGGKDDSRPSARTEPGTAYPARWSDDLQALFD